MKRYFCIVLALLVVFCTGCQNSPATKGEEPVTETISLPEDFIFGMDASCVPALEASGVKYHNFDGKEQDVFKTLAENGFNYIRVRVWNDPYDENGNGYGGGNCDIQNALAIGKRATAYGMKLLVNFHYSDFWADPNKQMTPKAWEAMTMEEKTQALYLYTLESLQLLKDNGVAVGMVQIGNETNGHMCGEADWVNISALMNAGSCAVREIFPDAQVAVHFAGPENVETYRYYAKQLDQSKVDYDIFASSYYPYWHGTLENLSKVLTEISQSYLKKVLIAETSYAYTIKDSDFSGNTISAGSNLPKPYEYSVDGQAQFLRDLTETAAQIPNCLGIFYWEGTWISVGQDSFEENQQLWEQYGSGWASSYAAAYDPKDAGKWYGGCAVENQALFDEAGDPLPSLKVFSQLLGG